MQLNLGLTKRKRYFVTVEHEGAKDELIIIANNPEGMKRILSKLHEDRYIILSYNESDLL